MYYPVPTALGQLSKYDVQRKLLYAEPVSQLKITDPDVTQDESRNKGSLLCEGKSINLTYILNDDNVLVIFINWFRTLQQEVLEQITPMV